MFNAIEKLITNIKKRQELQSLSLINFSLTNKHASNLIDIYRNNIIDNSISLIKKRLKIMHVTNFNERHNGRLFYNTGKRINNGFIRLGHSVLEFSDRDIVSYYRSVTDLDGSIKLNKKFIEVISNYLPDLIVLGHADLINFKTLKFIKENYPSIKICQWFLDRMDSDWSKNLIRFKDKMNIMNASFCTTDPKSLKLSK